MRSSPSVVLLLFTFCSLTRPQSHFYYPSGHCLKKICEQVVTGRHLPYGRILKAIHKREYLDAIHISRTLEQPPRKRSRRRRQVEQASTALAQGFVNTPLLMGIPLIILSAMFIASLRRKQQATDEPDEIHIVPVLEEPPDFILHDPPPLVPPHLPKPGQPGGGYTPDPQHHAKILSFVPYGLIPISVFPAFFDYYEENSQASPSECVVFAEASPPPPPPPIKIYPGYPHKMHKRSGKGAKKRRRRVYGMPEKYPSYHELPLIHHPAVPDILYGFKCVVTVIDKKVCNSTYQCEKVKNYEAVYGHGYFFQDSNHIGAFHPHYHFKPASYPPPLYYGRVSKRAALGHEFYADDIPQCRIQDTPDPSDCEEDDA